MAAYLNHVLTSVAFWPFVQAYDHLVNNVMRRITGLGIDDVTEVKGMGWLAGKVLALEYLIGNSDGICPTQPDDTNSTFARRSGKSNYGLVCCIHRWPKLGGMYQMEIM